MCIHVFHGRVALISHRCAPDIVRYKNPMTPSLRQFRRVNYGQKTGIFSCIFDDSGPSLSSSMRLKRQPFAPPPPDAPSFIRNLRDERGACPTLHAQNAVTTCGPLLSDGSHSMEARFLEDYGNRAPFSIAHGWTFFVVSRYRPKRTRVSLRLPR